MQKVFKVIGQWLLRAALQEAIRATWEHIRDWSGD